MGESKAQKRTINGRTVTDRTPAKKLNPFVKSKLLATLKRDDITIEKNQDWGSDTYIVKDSKATVLFSYHNVWDYGYYYITVGNIVIAETDWFENDGHTNAEQQSIFDIFNAITEKYRELQLIKDAAKVLTPDEIKALELLNMKQK